ncbi:MAG TPA: protein kinase [Bryobacteraceae bacterium]|nr:protein kinase [Bryobacteraceae bacterium]
MDRIGKYEITGELGAGGFGKVYKALDPTVGREVAIKVLNVHDDPVMVKRFRAEATTSASLQHKNIVTVHEFGEDRGQQYLVMEYLDGRNLQCLIRERTPVPMLDKLRIMSQVSQGLEHAHSHGVVHRDVKPANIMWLSDGSVKVMDFGIARMMHDAGTRLTKAGSMIGTVQYMAPEQFTSSASADARCDIWAYGVVLHEFLTGTNPFDLPNALEVMLLVTREETPALSLPGTPAGLTPLVKRLLSKSREHRYPSMEEVRLDLEQVILEVKQGEVASLERNAATLIQQDCLAEALSVVRQILDLDHSNEKARKWRKELGDRVRTESRQVRVQELMGQAETQVLARDYGAAADRLEEALRLDLNNSSVRARLEEIRSERERVQRSASLMAEARLELQHEALTSAFEHASQAAEADPRSQEAAALLDRVRNRLARRELEIRRRGALSKARGLILVQDYAGAAKILQDWAQQHPDDPEIEAKLEEMERLGAAYAVQLRVDRAIVESKDMIRRGSYRRAIEILNGMDQQIPEVSGLLTFAREQLEAEDAAANRHDEESLSIGRLVEECSALLLAGNLDQASARSAELAASYPAEASVTALRQEVARRVQEKRDLRRREAESLLERGRETALREAIAEVEELLARAKLLPAIAAANAALARFPSDPRILQLRQEAQQALARQAPETPSSRTLESSPEVPERGRVKIVVIGACVFVAAVLGALFLLRGG